MKRPKVFGIGFHKTGTSSLRQALKALGYRVTGPDFVWDEDLDWETLKTRAVIVARQFDAFQDNPWPLLFRDMDEEFPGSKFILTVRDEEAWYDSALHFFGEGETPMRRLIYGAGAPAGNEAAYRARYRAHYREAMAYFAHRPGDLLVMDVTAGDGWERLCPFLGLDAPALPFPKANARKAG